MDAETYRAWLKDEISHPEWHAGRPAWDVDPDHMWGTCFNDDCRNGIIGLQDVVRWRRLRTEGMVTYQGICRPCLIALIDGPES